MGPFGTVEDQAEAELVLVAVVVTGLQHMPECEPGKVGYSSAGKRASMTCASAALSCGASNGSRRSCRPAGARANHHDLAPGPHGRRQRSGFTSGAGVLDAAEPAVQAHPAHTFLVTRQAQPDVVGVARAGLGRELRIGDLPADDDGSGRRRDAHDVERRLPAAAGWPRRRLDRIGLHQVATTTIRSLLGRIAEALASPAPATEPAPWSSLTDRRRKTARLDGDDCS